MKKRTVKLSELCFYIFFATLLFAKGIGLYDGQKSFKLFLIIALAGWIGKMLTTQYFVWEIPLYALLIMLGGVVYLLSHEKGVLFVVFLLVCLKNMNLKKVFRVGAIIWGLSFGMLFFLTSLHVLDSPFKVHDRLGMGRIIRWSLGYAHPNVLHISYFVLVCFVIYLIQDKVQLSHLLLLELGNFYVFMYSLSTTGFLVTTICLILVFYWIKRKKFSKAEQILIQFCLPGCLFLSFVAPLLLKGKIFDIVNKLLNTRLELSRWFLQNLPIQLLGRDTSTSVTAVRTMDNSYVFAIITYGAIFFIFIIWEYFRIIYQKTKQRDGIALCLILSCLIAGLTEPFLFNTSFKNVSLLFIGTELFTLKMKKGNNTVGLGIECNIEIPFPNIAYFCREIWSYTYKYCIRLMVFSSIAALLMGIVIFQNASDPERYLLPRNAFEYTDDLEEVYYLVSEDDIKQDGDQILGFESEQTEMVAFKGNISKVERFRNTITGGFISGLLIFTIGNLAVFIKTRYKNGVQRNE